MPRSHRPFRRRLRRARKAAPRANFSKRVLKVLNSQRELKVSTPYGSEHVVKRAISNANGSIISIMPGIAQGDNEYERSGNQITLKKIVVNAYYMLAFPIADNADTRALVRHIIIKQRNSNASNILDGTTPLLGNNILENSSPYTGGITDYNTPINKNAFTVRKQIKKVMSCPNSQGATNQNAGSINKSYFMVTYTITFGKGKKLNYRTAGSSQPADFDYFLMHTASPMGEDTFFHDTSPVYYTQTVTAYYYDS